MQIFYIQYLIENKHQLLLSVPSLNILIFSSVQSLSHVRLFANPWTAACQASLSITNSRSLPILMSIMSVMPSNHLILCHPLLLLPSIFLSIRVFSSESILCIRLPKYWGFRFTYSDIQSILNLTHIVLFLIISLLKPIFLAHSLHFSFPCHNI